MSKNIERDDSMQNVLIATSSFVLGLVLGHMIASAKDRDREISQLDLVGTKIDE